MAKWRGFGGESNHWDHTLESMTTVAALAEVTHRVRIMPTVHTLAFNVGLIAKMIATLDQISGGRAGINIVSGWYTQELAQLGLWPDGITHDERYEVAREWVQVLKRLWAEDHVTFHGKYVHLEDCISLPKPVQKRPQIVCAGTSDPGLNFTIDEADVAFMGLRQDPQGGSLLSLRAKQFAAEKGKTIKTYALCMVVPGETDAEARARVNLYDSGVDMAAKGVGLKDTLAEIARSPDGGMAESPMTQRRLLEMTRRNAVGPGAFVGSAGAIAKQIKEAVAQGDWDGFLLTFPDFIGDLEFLESGCCRSWPTWDWQSPRPPWPPDRAAAQCNPVRRAITQEIRNDCCTRIPQRLSRNPPAVARRRRHERGRAVPGRLQLQQLQQVRWQQRCLDRRRHQRLSGRRCRGQLRGFTECAAPARRRSGIPDSGRDQKELPAHRPVSLVQDELQQEPAQVRRRLPPGKRQ